MGIKVISLSGEAGVGKSTLAVPLVRRGWKECSFAAPLKDMCKSIFSISDYFVNDPEGKKTSFPRPRVFTEKEFGRIIHIMQDQYELSDKQHKKITEIGDKYVFKKTHTNGKYLEFHNSRTLLQFVGTEICREIFPEYFLDMLKVSMESDIRNTIITDTRFPNERVMLKEDFGAQLVRIKRPGYTPNSLVQPKHLSESSFGLDEDYDIIILNDGKKDEFQDKAKIFI